MIFLTYLQIVTIYKGRVMVQGLSRLLLIVEKHVRSKISPCGICGRQSSIETDFSSSSSVSVSQNHSTSISYANFFHPGCSHLR